MRRWLLALLLLLPISAHAQSSYPNYVLGLPPSSQMTPPGVQPNDQMAIVRDKKHAYRAKPSEIIAGALQGAFDLLFGTVQGSIIYRGASGWVQLIPGAAGQCLLTGGPNANPSWGNCGTGPPPTGTILLTGGTDLLTIGTNLMDH